MVFILPYSQPSISTELISTHTGGGFSFGSPNGHRKLAAHLAAQCNATSLSLDYRLTPDHPFPAAIEDCITAYTWLLDNGYAAKNIVFAGDSCGGGLSTTVPLALRERSLPLPGASVSLSPWYDATYSQPSFQSNVGKDFINTLEGCTANADKYVAGGTAKTHPLVSPLFADLQGLNPHWISCAGDDMLRDDGVLLGEKAKAAGVEVVVEVHPDQQHVFEFMAGRAPEADASLKRIGEWVRGKIGS